MDTIYLACMCLGILFPLCSLVFNVFDDVFDAIFSELDLIGDFDVDGDLWFLPLSANSIYGFLLFFGGAGRLLGQTTKLGTGMVFIIAAVIGYVAAILIQFLIQNLKHVESSSVDLQDLLMYEGMVEHEIAKDGYGSVSFCIDQNIVTYPAISVSGEKIPQNTAVRVKEIRKENVLVVEPCK